MPAPNPLWYTSLSLGLVISIMLYFLALRLFLTVFFLLTLLYFRSLRQLGTLVQVTAITAGGNVANTSEPSIKM